MKWVVCGVLMVTIGTAHAAEPMVLSSAELDRISGGVSALSFSRSGDATARAYAQGDVVLVSTEITSNGFSASARSSSFSSSSSSGIGPNVPQGAIAATASGLGNQTLTVVSTTFVGQPLVRPTLSLGRGYTIEAVLGAYRWP